MPGIIVGVDGSAHSQWALQWGLNEAAIRHAPLTALAVHQRTTVSYMDDGLSLDQVVEEVQAIVSKAVSHRLRAFSPATVKVATGSPAIELVGASRGADLLVVGSRGSGGLGRQGVGSVSSRVASEAHCPVIIIFQPSSPHLRLREPAQTRVPAPWSSDSGRGPAAGRLDPVALLEEQNLSMEGV
jgi:nucleotide-binding universal stress UspA family protein